MQMTTTGHSLRVLKNLAQGPLVSIGRTCFLWIFFEGVALEFFGRSVDATEATAVIAEMSFPGGVVKKSFFLLTAGLAMVAALSGCENQARATSSPSPNPTFSAGISVPADRADLIAGEHDRIAEAKVLAEAKRVADEQEAQAAADAAEAQRHADEESQRVAQQRQNEQNAAGAAPGAFSRDDVLGTVQSLSGLPLAVVFDASWCDPSAYVCGGVYTRAPRAPSSIEELTIHMSDSPAWLYALVGYKVTVHEVGHALTAYYQPQILAAFGPSFLDTNIEKIADCYLILHVGGAVGTSGYSFDGLESEIAQWMVNNL